MSLLPEHLQNAVRVSWHLTSWCNYSCEYCGVLIYHKRAKDGQRQAHAFDHYSVERWLEAFASFPQEQIYLKITGGEPFLDRANLRELLKGLTSMRRFTMRIDTNGTWDPSFFADIDKSRILLNISYHPNEITLEAFLPRVRAIRQAGFTVSMVNFVLAPENIEQCERSIAALEHDGFFVNVGPMMFSGIYASRTGRSPREVEILEEYNPPIDLHYRLINPDTKGRLCYHPALSYYMLYDGSIETYCLGNWQNLFTDGLPALPREAVPCPKTKCDGCVEMYRSLVDEPLNTTPLGLYPLDEYVNEIKVHARTQTWKHKLRKVPVLNRLVKPGFVMPAEADISLPLLAPDAIKPALPLEPVFGKVESLNGSSSMEARSRDRLSFSGWAASREHGAPLKEIQIMLETNSMRIVRDFHPRPDIAAHFGRSEFVKSGWRTMVDLPALASGEYHLKILGVASDGGSASLGDIPLRIID
jgi:MoaA/NifB/PqqE/SkfB family radical SAM enzyme